MVPPSTAMAWDRVKENKKRPRPLGRGRAGEEALTMSRTRPDYRNSHGPSKTGKYCYMKITIAPSMNKEVSPPGMKVAFE